MDPLRASMIDPPEVAYSDWLTAAAPAMHELDWHRHLQVETPGEGISMAIMDVMPPYDARIAVEGPPTFSISLFLEGVGALSIDGGQPLEIYPGMAVFCATDRNVSGENHVRGGIRLRMVDVRFERSFLNDLGGPLWGHYGGGLLVDRSVPEQGALMMGFPASPALLQAAQQITTCPYRHEDVRRLYLRAKALEILAGLITALREAAETEPDLRPDRERQRIAQAQELIETRLDESWTITRLARTVSLNEKSLKSGFRTHVGHSIHAYLIKVRMEAAASMLAEGQSVTEVALATGFSNLSHFSKTFRRTTGLSPREYARRR